MFFLSGAGAPPRVLWSRFEMIVKKVCGYGFGDP